MLPQQAAALREAARMTVFPAAPRAHLPTETAKLPIPTAAARPKLFGSSIYFPRGDVGAQQFGRVEKADGEAWLNNVPTTPVVELSTSGKHGLRAFKAEGSEFIQYQRHERPKHLIPPSTPKRRQDL